MCQFGDAMYATVQMLMLRMNCYQNINAVQSGGFGYVIKQTFKIRTCSKKSSDPLKKIKNYTFLIFWKLKHHVKNFLVHKRHGMYTMSHFSSQNLIERSKEMQKQHFVATATIFFIDEFLRKSIIGISDNSEQQALGNSHLQKCCDTLVRIIGKLQKLLWQLINILFLSFHCSILSLKLTNNYYFVPSIVQLLF